ncbi:latent-transforming growth factor beta-binding protein 2 [Caerostris extrusa]|uniref:Latent-transforming growth factor beta-binding protein 2 n=1 Tax=Caerostris extrusa TaxID=172846 RepID=A0AAV4YA89_CAEEX|nr:latent-transforming growth factor beta-binding protein 2 [Caerostris extrusa]
MQAAKFATIVFRIALLMSVVLSEAPADGAQDSSPVKEISTSDANGVQTSHLKNLLKYTYQQTACKCDNGKCATEGGKQVCVCDLGFGRISSSRCKDCQCGEDFGCTFDVGFFTITKKCLCLEGFLEHEGVCTECNCGEHSVCKLDNHGGKICSCNHGFFEKDGRCEDCSCGLNGTGCQAISGIKFCACPQGYMDAQGVCVDIDECNLPDVCPPNSKCLNTPGSYECACEEGYEARNNASDAKFDGCQDIDECLEAGVCPFPATECFNLPGTYRCSCKQGFQPINLEGDPRHTRCRNNEASWLTVNIGLALLLVGILLALVGAMIVRRRLQRSARRGSRTLIIQSVP